MRKIFLVLILISGLAFSGFAEDTKEQTTIQKNSFRFDPDLFLSFFSTAVINTKASANWKWGLTVLGLDCTVFKHGKWNFLGVGTGVAVRQERNPGWYYREEYIHWDREFGLEHRPEGWYYSEYDGIFWPYLKFVPVKYRLDWISKYLHIELSITTNREIIFGLTFGWGLFKKQEKTDEN